MNTKEQDILKKIYSKEFRTKFLNNPRKHIEELGYPSFSDDVEVIVVKSTKDTMYIAFSDTNPEINLNDIQAAGASSSVSTGGTVGTATLTVGSASSLATAGSAF